MTLVCEILRVKDRVGGGLRRRPHNISFFVDGRRNQSKRRTFFQGEAQTNVKTTPDVEKKEGRAPRLSCSPLLLLFEPAYIPYVCKPSGFPPPGSAYRTAGTMKFCKLGLFPANRPGYIYAWAQVHGASLARHAIHRQTSLGGRGRGFLARLSLDRDLSRCVKSWPVSAQSAVSVAPLRLLCTICGRKQEQRTQRSLWRKATPPGLRASNIPAKVGSIFPV